MTKHNWKILCIMAFSLPDNPIAREATIQHRLILPSGQTRSSPPQVLLYFLNVGDQQHTLQQCTLLTQAPATSRTGSPPSTHLLLARTHADCFPHKGRKGEWQPNYDSLPLVRTSLLSVCCWWGDEIVGVYM